MPGVCEFKHNFQSNPSLRAILSIQRVIQIKISIAAQQSAACNKSSFAGYWTAKRRLDLFTTNRTTCLASPFVWDENSTSGVLLPAGGWEKATWINGQPDCYNGTQKCTDLAINKAFLMDDTGCAGKQCPLCQLDVN